MESYGALDEQREPLSSVPVESYGSLEESETLLSLLSYGAIEMWDQMRTLPVILHAAVDYK